MCNSVTALLGSISKPVYKLRSKPTGASNPVCVHTGAVNQIFLGLTGLRVGTRFY